MADSRRKLLPLLIAVLASTSAGAVGLGEIELHSTLGKPLEAVIPLNHLDDLGVDQLRVSLGNQQEYQALGVEFSYQHTLIKLEPVIKDGRAYVRVQTRDPVAEPYLDFVLNLRWPQGQVVREYAVLLDPPVGSGSVAERSPAAVQPRPVAADTAVDAAQIAPSAAAQPGAGAYRVQPGDSLWKLAARWRPAGVSVEQMMGAIHNVNPQAFVGNDPARLKAMTSLSVPSAEQIAAAGPIGSPPASSPVVQMAAESVPAVPPPVPAPRSAPAGIMAGPRDEELVAENATLKSQVSELSTNVAALNDSLEASQSRLRDMENKLGALVDQLERQRVTTQQLATAAGVAPPHSESLVNDARAGELLQAPPTHTPWWVHLSYWLAIGALGAGVAFTKLRPRRRIALAAATASDEIEDRLVEQASRWNAPAESASYWHQRGSAAELPRDRATPPAGTERPSFADVTVTRTAEDSVDPAVSAGVFAAFGRFDEAERVLNDALRREPNRVDLQLQLLDIYKGCDKRAAFIELAETLVREHADDDSTLQEVAALRSQYLD